MSFTDALKRSLGFEESESANGDEGPGISDMLKGIVNPSNNQNMQQNNQQQYRPNPQNVQSQNRPRTSNPQPAYDDFVITPEQTYYEIALIRPKTIDDINYVVDQVIEEKNPVILDLSFLEKESEPNFKLAGDKIKQMRERYGAQALLLSRTDDKNLIIVSPKKVKIVIKG